MIDLPCDCEHPCSFYLTLPSRTLREAVRDISKVRDLDDWVWDLVRTTPSNVVSLAAERDKRQPLVRMPWTA